MMPEYPEHLDALPFGGGTVFVPLAPVSETTLVAEILARAEGAPQ